ncbi:hypothetical protein GCM10010324_45190 [Streptomyces hiroshimensis]|uniref:Uncharacterized protein n=1 Tax=Streptomyces hiroshimensis TaxID=66424 RepID=A0ABQ2YWB3_9ACTN|nr:hypothetical protein GCM10010324_45190 [Streptomyces hiroshimensis]
MTFLGIDGTDEKRVEKKRDAYGRRMRAGDRWTRTSLFGPVPRPGCHTPGGHTPRLTELMLKSGTRREGIAARVK